MTNSQLNKYVPIRPRLLDINEACEALRISRWSMYVSGSARTVLGYQLVDGGSLDEDGVANSSIIDPIYIGEVAGTSTTAPTTTSTDGTLADTGNSIFTASLAAFALLTSAVILWRKNRKIYRHVSFR
jgi:LPXTG-motif cell wall-anchored protein